jgi:hypothetical protein
MSQESNPKPKVTIRRVTVLNNALVVISVVAILTVLAFAANLYLSPQENPSSLVEKFDLQRITVDETDRNDIENLLREASNFEFEMYKKAERPDTSGFSTYFVEGSPAFNKVWQSVSGVKERGWSLNNESNASYAAVLEVDVVNSDGKTAEAITRENWYLAYVTASTDKSIYTYSQLNCQYYQLRKTPDGWKIYLNHYPTTNAVLDK